MAEWQRHVYLNPEWDGFKDGGMTLQELGRSVVAKLRGIDPLGILRVDDALADIILEFDYYLGDPDLDIGGFNELMHRVWDWGDGWLDGRFDGKKVCWIGIDPPAIVTAVVGVAN